MLKPIAAALAVLALAGASSAQNAPDGGASKEFVATYNVIARGINAGDFVFNFHQTGASYEASASRRLTGAVRLLAGRSQDFQYSVRGAVGSDSALAPSYYRHQGGKNNRLVEVRFSPDDAVTTATPTMGMGHPPATPAQRRGVIDQLSAIAAMVTARADPCSGTIPVFMDGRSRFDFVMHPNGWVNVRGEAYRGVGIRCRVEFRPIAGFSDPQEPAELTFIFAPTESGMYAPVRIEMPSDDVGIIVLDARRLTVNGTRLR